MQQPIETAELLAFTRIVEALSLSRAALELGVPRATLSRRLARLETRLGARLLRRTTRRLALTEVGEAFYRQARLVLDAVSQAEASVRRMDDAVCGDLRISVPPIMTPGFYQLLCRFAERYPEVRLQVHFSSRHMDLQRDGYDVALRAGTDLEPGLVARTLSRMSMLAVASPAYLAERGVPRSAKDLKRHRCLLGFARGELPQSHWPLKGGGKLHVEGVFVSNEITLLAAAALSGLGIALLPSMFIGPALRSGQLVHVLTGVVEATSRVAVVYLEREFVPPHVKAFVEAMVEWGKRELATGEVTLQQLLRTSPAPLTGPEGGRGSGAKRTPKRAKSVAAKRPPNVRLRA
jgi:DNA-binding transcriptional LysR family regulator